MRRPASDSEKDARVPTLLLDEGNDVQEVALPVVGDGLVLAALAEELDALDWRIAKVGRIELVQEAARMQCVSQCVREPSKRSCKAQF